MKPSIPEATFYAIEQVLKREARRHGGPSSDFCFEENLERAKGLEPSTPTLARSCSTTELHPHPLDGDRAPSGAELCQMPPVNATADTRAAPGAESALKPRLGRLNRGFRPVRRKPGGSRVQHLAQRFEPFAEPAPQRPSGRQRGFADHRKQLKFPAKPPSGGGELLNRGQRPC
jgi:hypothetical protein